MPSSYFRKLSKERDLSMRALEEIYEKAKSIAVKKFDEEEKGFYPYTMGIFKRMLGVSESSGMQALARDIRTDASVRSIEDALRKPDSD